jgi:transposase
MGGDHRFRSAEYRTTVLELVARQSDLQEIRGTLATEHGIGVGLTSVWRFLKAQQITLKKEPARRRAKSPRHSRRAALLSGAAGARS